MPDSEVREVTTLDEAVDGSAGNAKRFGNFQNGVGVAVNLVLHRLLGCWGVFAGQFTMPGNLSVAAVRLRFVAFFCNGVNV